MRADAEFISARDAVVRRPGPFGPGRRTALTEMTDAWLAQVFAASHPLADGICLVAVGGHGRQELAPGSDLDLVLLHRIDPRRAAAIAQELWYPIWDAGLALDHSVRTVAEARRLASEDIKVIVGLLDLRVIAGDASIGEQLRKAIYADWRATAPKRIGELRMLVDQRRERFGELSTMLEPDLKEAYGGLREATVLRAIAASWITDLTHGHWQEGIDYLLDVRDALHFVSNRSSDLLLLQEQDGVAAALGHSDADELLRRVYSAARSVAYSSDSTWHRVERLTRRSPRYTARAIRNGSPERVPLSDGVVVQAGEVVLAIEARPEKDPVLILRAAASAAQAGIPLAPHTVNRLAQESKSLPKPWPQSARDAFLSLLGAGQSTLQVWEALDQAGVISQLIPGWEVVRSAPQRNALHRFTVDRHLVECVIQASALTRTVDRPDLLLLGALFHDFGKAREGDHSEVGAGLVAGVMKQMGYSAADIGIVALLVRNHLLLAETATRRDLDDPATVAFVADRIPDPQVLDLLAALTEADAIATGAAMWSSWRKNLIDELVRRVHESIAGRALPEPPTLTGEQQLALAHEGVWAVMQETVDGHELTIAAPDRIGLLATVAGVLAIHRLQVRSARVMTEGDRAVQVWNVQPTFGDPPGIDQLGDELRRAIEGSFDIGDRLRKRDQAYRPQTQAAAPIIDIIEEASERTTVLEVRAHDAPGLLYRVTRAIASTDAAITGAKVTTLGSDAVDVFFLVDRHGNPLNPQHAAAVKVTVLGELLQPLP
ncbi:MAG: [protein-PII] uridylyltransferase [Candidatus Nanopelagicales bacterium]